MPQPVQAFVSIVLLLTMKVSCLVPIVSLLTVKVSCPVALVCLQEISSLCSADNTPVPLSKNCGSH